MNKVSKPMLDILNYYQKKFPNSKWNEVSIDSMINAECLTPKEFEYKYGHLEQAKSFKTKMDKLIPLYDDIVTKKNFNNIQNPFNNVEENKLYRIPAISEFIDGFEYEVFLNTIDNNFDGWYNCKFGEDKTAFNWNELEEVKQELINNKIRVKIENNGI